MAEAGALEGGYENISQFIRACVRQGARPLLPVGMSLSGSVGAQVVFDAAACPDKRMHRKGTLCKSCQTIAAKDGE